jgi:hypothetical protein
MASAEAAFNGELGRFFRLHLDVSEVAVDQANNRSLVNVTVYWYATSASTGVWNFNPTFGNIVVNGVQVNFSTTYDYRGNTGPKGLISNYQQWIGHDGNGNGSVGVSAYYNADDVIPGHAYVTDAGTSLGMGLTPIPRYLNFTGFSVTDVTDVGFHINVSTDVPFDLLQYSLDGGASWAQVYVYTTGYTVVLTDLPSGRDYPVLVWARRADSGLASVAGPIVATTPEQGKWLAFF